MKYRCGKKKVNETRDKSKVGSFKREKRNHVGRENLRDGKKKIMNQRTN